MQPAVSRYRPGDGATISYCVWSEWTTLLPKTDEVLFHTGGEDAWLAAWDRVRQVMGERMAPDGLDPERYRVGRFPSPGDLAAMGAAKLRR